MQITNVTGISLPLAVWLAHDTYDFTQQGKAISATSLLKPVRQILLSERLTEDTATAPDTSDYLASRLGHAIHDGIERAWKDGYRESLKKLGYPDKVIEAIRINPIIKEPGTIPVYIEKRTTRQIAGYTISGKLDMALDGELVDFKSTSVFALKGSKDRDYQLQGSIYRWLNQDIITSDYLKINFVFTDWQKALARQNPDYPQQRVYEHPVKLLSLEETEAWIRNKFRQLEEAAELPEEEIPHCSDEELWRSDTIYKYYSDPNKTSGKSTKNFTDLGEANKYRAEKGKGIVLTVPGAVKACTYCRAFPICSQKDLYVHDRA